MLDVDLALLYGVTIFNLNKAVKRNSQRFPEDFIFQLNSGEAEPLKFQTGMSKTTGRGGRRTLPFAFTQEGIAMLSSVLRSEQAIHALEARYERKFKIVFEAIRKLLADPPTSKKPVH